MRRLIAPFLVPLLIIGCSGNSDPPSAVPPAATAMNEKLQSGMTTFLLPRIARYEGFLTSILNPGTPLAQGVALAPDMSPGAPPFSFTFTGPYDGNEDGFNESTLSGSATFGSDPDADWSSVSGQSTADVDIPVLGHLYHSDLTYSITSAQRQISGTGTFADPMTGNTSTMTVAAGAPLVLKPATGAPGAVSNACGYSLEGQMGLAVTGPTGTLNSTWNFSSASPSVQVSNASFVSPSGEMTALPDATIDTPCGVAGSINDWVGTYTENWACLPRESGQATITIVVTGADTVQITDEDPPGSGNIDVYTAQTIGGDPHSLRGFFNGGPAGSQYREDFNWTLRTSLSGFAQFSSYKYFEGPKIDKGGICVASAPLVTP